MLGDESLWDSLPRTQNPAQSATDLKRRNTIEYAPPGLIEKMILEALLSWTLDKESLKKDYLNTAVPSVVSVLCLFISSFIWIYNRVSKILFLSSKKMDGKFLSVDFIFSVVKGQQ